MTSKPSKEKFRLVIPLDASGVEGLGDGGAVKVAVQSAGKTQSQIIKVNGKGAGDATFNLEAVGGVTTIVLGPPDADDEEVFGLQTMRFDLASTEWKGKRELTLQPILIAPYYWFWWRIWCRRFVIRGRLQCPDGSPVPGATVCAYDVDWWWIFSSSQQLGCGTTDANGVFSIIFRWCCGWWPWWWWRSRVWELNPLLNERVAAVLKRAPHLQLSASRSTQPSLEAFRAVLAPKGQSTRGVLSPRDVGRLDSLRETLIQTLPTSPELAALRVWPWWPWRPWWDCAPDIIFRATQDCTASGTVVLNETILDTRWNASSPLDVTLTASDRACCRPLCPPGVPCEGGECLVVTQVCTAPIDTIGGNTGAAAAPAGYLNPGGSPPGTVDYDGDRPFAGGVSVVKNFGPMVNVDYYEIEYFNGAWLPLPPGMAQSFVRRWMHMVAGFPTMNVPFNFTNIAGHEVVVSKERYEAISGLGVWGVNYIWILNEYLVVPLDSTKVPDGTYRFRVVGWQDGGGGTLINRRVLPLCGTQTENGLVLTFDNRVLDPVTHPVSHNCGGVHICTREPDTHIEAVRVGGRPVAPCDTVDSAQGDLEIDFLVTDPDGHLATYTLIATYGLNLAVNLLNRPSSNVVPLAGGIQTGWDTVPAGANEAGTYGIALAQGGVSPHWYGGRYRLTVRADEAFPEPCCYQLELRGYKRTVLSCDGDYHHNNLTEYTLGVGVCPPRG